MKNKNKPNSAKGFIVSDPLHNGKDSNLQLLRITITELETKVDFGYQATDEFYGGGWIKISPKTFIRPNGGIQNLILTNATNIPYGPEKLHFNSTIEWRYFSLIFPPINPETKFFDLIEKENGTDNDFNFYGIRLDDEKKKSTVY
jgi:hypothetical protein